jgi:hypothetical protein
VPGPHLPHPGLPPSDDGVDLTKTHGGSNLRRRTTGSVSTQLGDVVHHLDYTARVVQIRRGEAESLTFRPARR